MSRRRLSKFPPGARTTLPHSTEGRARSGWYGEVGRGGGEEGGGGGKRGGGGGGRRGCFSGGKGFGEPGSGRHWRCRGARAAAASGERWFASASGERVIPLQSTFPIAE